MTSQKMIPQLVRATIRMHRSTAELRLARLEDQLGRITTVTRRASELRYERQQLREQVAAWEYLAVLVEDPLHGAAAMSDDTPHTSWVPGPVALARAVASAQNSGEVK